GADSRPSGRSQSHSRSIEFVLHAWESVQLPPAQPMEWSGMEGRRRRPQFNDNRSASQVRNREGLDTPWWLPEYAFEWKPRRYRTRPEPSHRAPMQPLVAVASAGA